MKKLLITFLCLYGFVLFGQSTSTFNGPSIRLTAYTIYALDDNHVESYYSTTAYFEGKVKGGFQWGGGIEVMPIPTTGVEFTYLRLDSKAPMTYYDNGPKSTNFNLNHNYFLIGGNQYLKVNPKIEPFLGFMLGLAVYGLENPENSRYEQEGKFAWGFKGGMNYWPTVRIGLKMQASLLSCVQAIGGGFYFGTSGTGASISGFSTYFQFNVGGGLIIRLR